MAKFVLYEGDSNTRRGEENNLGSLLDGSLTVGEIRLGIDAKRMGGTVTIELTEETSKRISIMGADGNWMFADKLYDLGWRQVVVSAEAVVQPGMDGSMVLFSEPGSDKWKSIHFEREREA